MTRTILFCFLALITLAGCSQSEPSGATAKETNSSIENNNSTTSSKSTSQAEAEVKKSTTAFLQSVVRGDAQTAAQWLTPLAAQRAAADPSVLAPLGFQVESLQVSEVRIVSEFEAAAECLLKEYGSNEPESVCCLLKLDSSGWKVCGMACDAGPGEPPVLISFEHEMSPNSESGDSGEFVGGNSNTPNNQNRVYQAQSGQTSIIK